MGSLAPSFTYSILPSTSKAGNMANLDTDYVPEMYNV